MIFRSCLLATASLVFSLWGCSGAPDAASNQAADSGDAAPKPSRNRLLFCGDVMLCRDVGAQIRRHKDPAYPFRKIAPFLAAADLTFVNLESPFADRGPRGDRGMVFRAPPETIEGLVLSGVDVAATANNHTRDCGSYGVTFTIDWLKQHHIEPVGTAATSEAAHEGVVLERNGVRFGFLAYTYDQNNGNWRDTDPRIAMLDPEAMRRDVSAIRKKSDVVIVSMHAGYEYRKNPNAGQVQFAHQAIDAGAALVIGHHPHVTQPMEKYRDGVIFYSLGNFIFDQYQRVATQHGEIAEVTFSGHAVEQTNLYPISIKQDGPELDRRKDPVKEDKIQAPSAKL
ncbi:MAG TPA: CapA family protein [Bryobacteraceae bacterium]|jgi:poly-gamma-glutamate synthesis protein (capsule biosynthesis protein)|nr:CapA family protein [Bryobacteraceae bacterium]